MSLLLENLQANRVYLIKENEKIKKKKKKVMVLSTFREDVGVEGTHWGTVRTTSGGTGW
jgi:hypothetical protein